MKIELTDAQWARISRLLPKPNFKPKGGRPRANDRLVPVEPQADPVARAFGVRRGRGVTGDARRFASMGVYFVSGIVAGLVAWKRALLREGAPVWEPTPRVLTGR